MIRAYVDLDDLTLEMKGHAGMTGDNTFDMVCCAASFCAQQLLYSCEEENERDNSLKRQELKMEPGDMRLHLVPVSYRREKYRQKMLYAMEGLELLVEMYPAAIELATKGKEGEEDL